MRMSVEANTVEENTTLKRIEKILKRNPNIPQGLRNVLSTNGHFGIKYGAFTRAIKDVFENTDGLYMALFYLKLAAGYWNQDGRKNGNGTSKTSKEFVECTLKVLDLDIKDINATQIVNAGEKISEFSLQGLVIAIDRTQNKKEKEFLIAILNKYSTYKKKEE